MSWLTAPFGACLLGLSNLFDDRGANACCYIPGSTPPKALIIGDSCLWMYKLDDLAESFPEMVFVSSENAGGLWRMADAFKPDIVSCCSIDIDEIYRQLALQQGEG